MQNNNIRSQALTRTFCVNSIHLSVPGGCPLTRTIVVNSCLFTVPGEFVPKTYFFDVSWEAGGGEFFWSKKTGISLSEGPNLDILWVFRDEIGSVRTRIVDLMKISVSKFIFYRVFVDFGFYGILSKTLFVNEKSFVVKKNQVFQKNVLDDFGGELEVIGT